MYYCKNDDKLNDMAKFYTTAVLPQGEKSINLDHVAMVEPENEGDRTRIILNMRLAAGNFVVYTINRPYVEVVREIEELTNS